MSKIIKGQNNKKIIIWIISFEITLLHLRKSKQSLIEVTYKI